MTDPNRTPVVEALRELVACKDLADKFDVMKQDVPDFATAAVLEGIQAEYLRRKTLAWSAARAVLSSLEQAQPEHGETLWLWKNGDHFLAFRNLYPCVTPGGDPMTLGEPFGRAIFVHSHNRKGKPNG